MRRILLVLALGFCVLLPGVVSAGGGDGEVVVRVSAAASLSDVLKEVNGRFREAAGVKVEMITGGSNVLARQIEGGMPADVFLSADAARMDVLAAKGLILEETRREVLGNALVLVVPADSGLRIVSLSDLAADGVQRIVTGDPRAVPAGVYAKEILAKAGIWERVRPKIVATDSVRAALAAVESGNLDAGIVYRTDARISRKVKVAYEIPLPEGVRIVYPAAVLREAVRPDLARRYLEFLQGAGAETVFRRYGFVVPAKADAGRAEQGDPDPERSAGGDE